MIEKKEIISASETQDKYQEFMVKLAASKKSVQEDESLHFDFEKVKEIYVTLKGSNSNDFFRKALVITSVMTLMACLAHIIVLGVWVGIVGLIFTLVFLVVNKIIITQQVHAVNDLRSAVPGGLINATKLDAFSHYVSKGIDLKLRRFELLAVLFGGSAFFFFTTITEIILERIGIIEIIVALGFGLAFAILCFYKDFNDLKNLRKKLEAV